MLGKTMILGSFIFVLFVFTPIDTNAHEIVTHTIEMKDRSFSPTDITITQGDVVIFKNLDDVDRWPASNIHPTHEVYSDFDPKKEIHPGESWNFTFDKAGSWRFHDHILPELTGSITVTKDADFIETEITTSKHEVSFWHKLKVDLYKLYFNILSGQIDKKLTSLNILDLEKEPNELTFWLEIFGPKLIMDDLLKDSGDGANTDCHQPAHIIGRISYEIYGANSFKEGNASCHSGYYHGAMEAFLQEKGTDNITENVDTLCSLFDTNFGTFECLHGVGHGVMAYEDYDLPKSLKVCSRLQDPFSVNSCYGGVFMENIIVGSGGGTVPGHQTKWLSDDPHFPCNIFNDLGIVYQCYQMQTSRMLDLYEHDFDKVVEECEKATPQMIPVCYKSLGRDASGFTLRDGEKTIEICEKISNKEYFPHCIEGAINVVIDFWGQGLNDQASRFCDAITGEQRKYCYEIIAHRIPYIFTNTDDIKRVCDTFTPEYKPLCIPEVAKDF